MILPQGKYQGVSISRVRTQYLEWALENWKNVTQELLDAIEKEIEHRGSVNVRNENGGQQT